MFKVLLILITILILDGCGGSSDNSVASEQLTQAELGELLFLILAEIPL